MYILGISAYYHDSSAVLLKDNKIICATEEERFSRIKHDNQFPHLAINFCLKEAHLTINDIDYIAYYEKPLLKFERIMEDFIKTYPFSFKTFLNGLPEWLNYKIKIEQIIRKKIGFKGKINFIPHHLSHASTSFYSSPFKQAAVLAIDGVGEYATTSLWLGKENHLELLKFIEFPHSLGLLYSTFTSFLGFRVNEDEYKVMGLAAYGKPLFINKIHQIIDIKNDGSFKLNMKYFSFREDFRMWSKNFENLFGKPRLPEQKITQRDKHIAASIQEVTENIYFKILNHLYDLTRTKNLCVSGGVALNALANGKIFERTPFKKVFILGAAGDNGAALGAALFTGEYTLGLKERYNVNNLYFGSSYNDSEIEKTLKEYKLRYKKINDESELVKITAKLLAENKIIGWFQNKMEFGPRALGARSILANPKQRDMKDKVNRIKIREPFRPFAGSILEEKVEEYFKIPKEISSFPFMTFCFKVKREKINKLRAIVHKDKTCRIQTVNTENTRYYTLIKEFYKITGIPCILNTSYNLKGEPIVENPQQAIEDFLKTKMDYLVIGNYLVYKSNHKR